jgi:hypothetical protein
LSFSSSDDYSTRLPLLDNAISFIPFVAPQFIGAAQERRFFAGVQLNVVYSRDETDAPIQGSFYGPTGVLRTDLLMDLPLSIKGNLTALRYSNARLWECFSCFILMSQRRSNYLKLNPGEELEVHYQRKKFGVIEKHFISTFRKLALFSLPSLVQVSSPRQ